MWTDGISQLINPSNPYLEWLIVVAAAFILDFVQRFIFHRLGRRLRRTRSAWDDGVVEAIPAPLSLIIWISVAAYIISGLSGKYGWHLSEGISTTRSLLIIIIFTWFILRIVSNLEKTLVRRAAKATDKAHGIDQTSVLAIGKIARVIIVLLALLLILPTMGYSISGLLAFGGAGALIISLAAQNLLSNFFGGLMIYLDRPFAIGEWIRSPDQNIEGTVEHMGWRITRIRTFDKRPLYVPNSVFTKISVENPQRMWNRRIKESIGVRYDDIHRVPKIVERMKNLFHTHEEIDQNQTIIIAFNEFGPSSLDILVYAFTRTTNWIEFHEVKQRMLLAIGQIIEEEGAEIAFPTSTIHFGEGLSPIFEQKQGGEPTS